MIIYHYCHEGGLSILKDARLLLSPPSSFNDPFELAPKSVEFTDMTRERGIEMLTNHFDTWYERIGQFRGFATKEAAHKYVFSHLNEIVDEMLAAAPNNAETIKENFLKDSSKIWAIGCFSKRRDSILMWAHYAKKHTGVIIGFDTTQVPFNRPGFLALLEVEYGRERPVFIHRRTTDEFEESFHLVARSKSEDWAYEEEVRIVVPLSSLVEARFMPLVAKSVVCVIYGCNCPPAFRTEAFHYLGQPLLSHVGIYEAKLHKSEYRLDFVELRKGGKPAGA